MLGIIGYQDDVIGFGLTGIQHVTELTRSAKEEEVAQAIRDIKQNTRIIMINETLLDRVRNRKEFLEQVFIEIPEDKTKTNLDEIEKLTKETLGINF